MSRRGIQVMDGSAIAMESSRVLVLIVLCRVDKVYKSQVQWELLLDDGLMNGLLVE